MIFGYKDSLNYISKLNGTKVFNLLKLLGSYYFSRITKKNFHNGMPFSISIEPTTSCNLRCPHCPSGLREFSRPTGMLEPELYKKIIDEIAPTLTYLTLYFQGEPLLHRHFVDLISYASRKKIYTATSTNAHHIDKTKAIEIVNSGLDKLIISIDGTTHETYSHYRIGGNLDKVLEATKFLVEAKKTAKKKNIFIVWQFIAFKHNEHEIDEIKKLGKHYGVDKVVIKSAQVYNMENADNWLPENKKYSRYEDLVLNGFTIKNKLLNHCWRMWQGCVITWDGKVVPCCFDKDAKYQLGEMQQTGFKKIWLSEGYEKFRRNILKSRKEIDICKNCSEGTKIWL